VLSRRSSDITQMVRDFGALVGAHDDDAGIAFESLGSLLLLGMIIMSLSIISMIIFPCGHDDNESGRFNRRSDIVGRGSIYIFSTPIKCVLSSETFGFLLDKRFNTVSPNKKIKYFFFFIYFLLFVFSKFTNLVNDSIYGLVWQRHV
jgi:hypothetical protein